MVVGEEAVKWLEDNVSQRIKAISSQARMGWPIYDLCCDHGLIGFHILSTKNGSELVLVDQIPSIIKHLDGVVSRFGVGLPIKTKLMDAAQVNLPMKNANVVIAGVGTRKTVSILKSLYPDGPKNHKLILNPNGDSNHLENYLLSSGWESTVSFVEERGHRHRIISCSANLV